MSIVLDSALSAFLGENFGVPAFINLIYDLHPLQGSGTSTSRIAWSEVVRHEVECGVEQKPRLSTSQLKMIDDEVDSTGRDDAVTVSDATVGSGGGHPPSHRQLSLHREWLERSGAPLTLLEQF